MYEDLEEPPDDFVADPQARVVAGLVKDGQGMVEAFTVNDLPLRGVLPGIPGDGPWRHSVWYSQALEIVDRLTPLRRPEFERLYETPNPSQITSLNYGAALYINGISVTNDNGLPAFDHARAFSMAMGRQNTILMGCIAGIYSAEARAASDDELQEARRLLGLKSWRAAGCLAGIALERHLRTLGAGQVPPIQAGKAAALNDALKGREVYVQATWRLVSLLLDTRNMCAHPDGEAPSVTEVERLVSETERLVAGASAGP